MPPGAEASAVSVDRGGYAAQQSALLEALLRGGELPAGFAAAKADAARQSLRCKRVGALRQAWPALTVALGASFDARFDAFARTTGPPAFGEGVADGLAFVSSLAREEQLGDDVRVEILFARAILVRDRRGDRGWRPRRDLFLRVARLRHPHRLLLVVHLPLAGRRHASLRLRLRRAEAAP
jgi:hypothetical protein